VAAGAGALASGGQPTALLDDSGGAILLLDEPLMRCGRKVGGLKGSEAGSARVGW